MNAREVLSRYAERLVRYVKMIENIRRQTSILVADGKEQEVSLNPGEKLIGIPVIAFGIPILVIANEGTKPVKKKTLTIYNTLLHYVAKKYDLHFTPKYDVDEVVEQLRDIIPRLKKPTRTYTGTTITYLFREFIVEVFNNDMLYLVYVNIRSGPDPYVIDLHATRLQGPKAMANVRFTLSGELDVKYTDTRILSELPASAKYGLVYARYVVDLADRVLKFVENNIDNPEIYMLAKIMLRKPI